MKKNVGSTDRLVRFVVAAVALVLSLVVGVGSVGGLVLLVVAVIMAFTGAVGTCPLYLPFGISTCKVRPGTKA
ncbi:MAG: DUF2892 domain-containing protein [Acidimicrobiales bacterium]